MATSLDSSCSIIGVATFLAVVFLLEFLAIFVVIVAFMQEIHVVLQ